MSYSKWIVGVVASMLPLMVHAQDRVFDTPQRVDGLAVYLDFQPAAMAQNWSGFHRPTDVDTVAHSVKPDLNRHVVVVVIDEETGQRVGDADIEVVVTPTMPAGKPYSRQLDRMTSGANSSYGAVVTIDPASCHEIEVVVRRPDMRHESRVRFDTQPAR